MAHTIIPYSCIPVGGGKKLGKHKSKLVHYLFTARGHKEFLGRGVLLRNKTLLDIMGQSKGNMCADEFVVCVFCSVCYKVDCKHVF